MKTFKKPKALVVNPHYHEQRQQCLAGLSDDLIDMPIIDVINRFNKLPYCFTLQSCYGHFIYRGQNDPHNLTPLPLTDTIDRVEYRIAYIALCVENNDLGRMLIDGLKRIEDMDPANIQFCCAEWFWKRQINSYALQVEPDRFKCKDRMILDYNEAIKIERIRNDFFIRLRQFLQKLPGRDRFN